MWPKIEKKFDFKDKFDSTLMAYQFDKTTVRVRAVLPEKIDLSESDVKIVRSAGKIILSFPEQKTASYKGYDEKYLETLLKNNREQEKIAEKKEVKVSEKTIAAEIPKTLIVKEDKVNVVQSSLNKNDDQLSLTNYLAKFVAFFIVLAVGLFIVLKFFRKSVMKKGKLGFLNSTNLVEVLSTTHVAPKKSVLLLRVHNQVFVVGNTDHGLQMISELKDTTGLIKEGEKQVAGDNFDINIGSAVVGGPELQLKQTIDSNEMGGDSGSKSRPLSEQIRSKVKSLKSIQ